MKREFLAWLACPQCGCDLRIPGDSAGRPETGLTDDILGGSLECAGCPYRVEIVRGIPRFIASDDYTSSFSFEWTRFATTQLDSARGGNLSEERFRESVDFPLEELKGRLVLDAGCGMGRFAEIVAKYGGTVVAADLSYAVESARQNLARWEHAHVIQADLRGLPLKSGVFDFIYSLGVLHHTPDPRRTFEGLVRYLKPGGRISITLYSGYNKVYVTSTNLWRRLTIRLPSRIVYYISHLAIPLYYFYRLPGLGLIARAIWPISLHPDPEWRLLDTFDCYTPRYQFFYTHPEVYRWFRDAGLRDIAVLEPGISFIGSRPDAEPREA